VRESNFNKERISKQIVKIRMTSAEWANLLLRLAAAAAAEGSIVSSFCGEKGMRTAR